MAATIPHSWALSVQEAIALQRELASLVDVSQALDVAAVSLVAGVDVHVKEGRSRAAVVTMTFPDLVPVEAVTAELPTTFPYIPGLLTFREGEVILRACERLGKRPDLYLFDGMGIMHPRRLGIASHIGLWLDTPTCGCGKTYLLGEHGTVGLKKGASADVQHKGQRIGTVLRTRENVKPVYTSPGHLMRIDDAQALILACTKGYRLPEPIRAAHRTAAAGAMP